MLESFLSDFSFIKETLDKDGDHQLFGKSFSFFSIDPILFYHSAKDVIIYANSSFTDEFNYTVDDLANWKYSIYPLLSSEGQETFRQAMKDLQENDGGSTPDASYKLISKNKKYSYYRLKVRKLYKSYYFIQIENSARTVIPVLKNKTADELMNDAEAILKFGFWMLDKTTDKLFWTKGMFNLLEYDNEEDAGNVVPTLSFLHEHIIKDEAFLDFEKKLENGELKDNYSIKYHVRTGRDNIRIVSEHGRIERDEAGNIRYITGLTRDITAKEQSLKSLADYQSMMLENEAFLNYGTWESNADGSNFLWTDGMYKMFGYNNADKDKLELTSEIYKKHALDPGANASSATAAQFLKGKDFYQREFEIRDKEGAIKILSTYAKIIRDEKGEVQKIIGTTRDVTQLKEYEKTLENKIIELNRSNGELEEFAYVASHDMQEPLRKISTFGQRLKNQLSSELGEDGNLYLSRMLNAADNMRKLIDNLLEFSRISKNKQEYEKVALSETIQEVMDDLDISIAESDARISLESIPSIEANPAQMKQLFFNLLHNAIKFRKKNTPFQVDIKGSVLDNRDKSFYHLIPSKKYYLVTVSDNGIGLEQQYAEKIFQLFQRLEGKSEYPGSGIGLSICRKIVTNHNGLIFASGEPGKGTVFSIILPQDQ